MKEYKNMDDLLKRSLSYEEVPSSDLNERLKFKLENKDKEENVVSVWWIPMVMSIIIGIISYTLIKMFVPMLLIQKAMISLCFGFVFFNVVMTFIGVKYFELKKGAKINI